MADLSVTVATVALSSGPTVSGTAGETITAGMPVYLKASDLRLYKAVGTSVAAAAAVGIALHASLAGQPLVYAASGAVINLGATTAAGLFYYVSAGAAGGIAPVADLASTNKVTVIGYATGTSGAVFTVLPIATGSALA